jgi:hypothetical protein
MKSKKKVKIEPKKLTISCGIVVNGVLITTCK